MSKIPAGWHRHPDDPSYEHFWDGSRWTGEKRPIGSAAPPGWYPDPEMAATRRYWDGAAWTDNVAPADTTAAASNVQVPQVLSAAIVGGAGIGVAMALQSASLLTGTGTQWTGAAIAVVASILSFVMIRTVATWAVVVALLAALLAVGNAVYLEVQIEKKRDEISDIFE